MCNSASSDPPNPDPSFGLRQFRFYKRARRRRYWSFPGAQVPPAAFSWLSSASPAFLRTYPEYSEGQRLTGRGLSLPAAISVLPSCFSFLAAAPRFFFDCALYATLICLLSLGCTCMGGGDSPCFSRGYRSVLINSPGGISPAPTRSRDSPFR